AVGRHDPERDTDADRHAERDDHGQPRDDGGDARNLLDARAQAGSDDDPRHAAGHTDEHGFAQELQQDVPLRSPHSAPHTDFADALEHGGQHDVHDSDAAHDQRNRRDRAQHDVEDRFGAPLLLEEQLGHRDLEIHHRVVTAGQQ